MDGHSQMVFCAHLSYTADRERGKSENQKEKKVFIDCKNLHTAA